MADERHFLQNDQTTARLLKQYEYDCKTIRPPVLVTGESYLEFVKTEFNILGKQGWEVIQFITVTQDGLATIVWVKRLLTMQFSGESQVTQIE